MTAEITENRAELYLHNYNKTNPFEFVHISWSIHIIYFLNI